MAALDLAAKHYRQQVGLARRIALEVARLWRQLDRTNLDRSWYGEIGPKVLTVVTAGQLLAAQSADPYLDAILDVQGIDPEAAGAVNARALAGVASDGRGLDTLLYEPVIATKQAIARGAAPAQALKVGQVGLDLIARTQVADAGRVASGMAVAARMQVGGYTRMLNPPSCSRCVVLAGRWYRWNAGFDRHPRCDCVHVPVQEDTADEVLTEPRLYFDSLSRDEQDKVFTQAGAQAIRDGADISQVVNARRGARGIGYAAGRLTAEEKRMLRGGRPVHGHLDQTRVFGRDLYITTEGTTTRGVAGVRLGARETGTKQGGRYRTARAPRLMPESIYEIAGNDRQEAIRLLRRFGYIT